MENTNYLLGYLSIAVVLGVIGRRLWFSPLSDVPGPFWARTSNLWRLWHVYRGTYRLAIVRAHQVYGPLVRVSHQEVSICDEDAVRKILLQSLDKDTWYSIFAIPDSRYGNQMSELSAKRFAATQKKVIKAYSMSQVLKFESKIDKAMEAFKSGIEKVVQREGSVWLATWFSFYSLDLVASFQFSQDFGFLRSGTDVGNSVANSDKLVKYFTMLAFFPRVNDVLQAVMGPVLQYFDADPMKHVMQTTQRAIEKRDLESDGISNSEDDMIGVWKSYKGADPLTSREVLAIATGNVAAAGDSTATAMQTFVYLILKYPRVKTRLLKELQTARRNGDISSPAQYNAILNLPYFQACLKEVFRYHSPGATGMPRIAPTEGIDIGGKHFPAGTVVSTNIWAMHLSEALFGPDASEFKPERWLAEKGDSKVLERYLIHFGAGYMTCPGRHLALVEMSKLLVTLFLDYDIQLENPDAEWRIGESLVVKGYDWKVTMARRTTA